MLQTYPSRNGLYKKIVACLSPKAIIILSASSLWVYIGAYLQICELLPNAVCPTVDVQHPFPHQSLF